MDKGKMKTVTWVKLKLVGGKANRAAIGARIQVVLRTPAGPRGVYRTVNSGASFGSNPLRQEIGLGNATAIASVEILWPGSNTHQTVTQLALDHSYEIHEGELSVIPVKMHPVRIDHSTPVSPGSKVEVQR